MALSDYQIQGAVAKLVTDEDLIINKGSDDHVVADMIFYVLDPLTQDVRDPVTGEDLGSIDRTLARVRVTEVYPRMSLAHLVSRRHSASFAGISATAKVLTGYVGPARLTSDTWPEGVKERHPVVSKGEIFQPPASPPPRKPDPSKEQPSE